MNTLKLGSRGEEVRALQLKLRLYADGIFGKLTDEAVREFQRANGLTADGIVGPQTWAKLGVSAGTRYIKEIIVHCTATPEGRDFSVEQIRQCHLARGFSDVGYHYVIYRDGSLHIGRPEAISGAHCYGHNAISIGVCYVGGTTDNVNVAKDTRTPAQKCALIDLLKALKKRYPGAKIYGHRDFAAKECPSFDATKEYSNI